jgi:sulfatase maturation enzyme AslB (radical SAM superfamily)
MKQRVFKDKNYKGIFINNKTIRIALDSDKDIKELDYPEFYDVKITPYCKGGCGYCYMDSRANYKHTEDIIQKLNTIFEPMSQNERPFTIAIGGGEPTTAPQFCEFIKAVDELGIVPNYTTNGMFIKEHYKRDILEVTEKYCGGVAVSCHDHLKKYWHPAVKELLKLKDTEVNFHHVIFNRKSIDYFVDIFNEFKDEIDHFVLLPHIPQGRAIEKEIDLEYLTSKVESDDKLAFGAGFHPFLKSKEGRKYKVSLYEPELLSKFIDLGNMTLYPSSFCTDKPLKVFK